MLRHRRFLDGRENVTQHLGETIRCDVSFQRGTSPTDTSTCERLQCGRDLLSLDAARTGSSQHPERLGEGHKANGELRNLRFRIHSE